MKVLINGKETITPDGSTINTLLHSLEIATDTPIAVAVNNNVIERAEWEAVVIKENDNIIIISAICGG